MTQQTIGGPEANHVIHLISEANPVLRDAGDVARLLRPEDPVLCFAPDRLTQAVRRFASFPGTVAYAVKANPAKPVLRALAAAGINQFDTASVDEIALVKSLAPDATCHYHNPVKSRAEIARAFEQFGVRRFSVDHPAELNKICDVVGSRGPAEIAIRFRMTAHKGAVHDFSTKFGAMPEHAAQLLRAAAERGMRPLLTFHPGSQCIEPDAYRRHIKLAAEIAETAEVKLDILNVGGGFPARYPSLPTPALEEIFAAILEARDEAFPSHKPALEAEPGRALVCEAFSLLAQVKLVKRDTAEIYLNDGIYGALMEYSQTKRLSPPYRIIDPRQPLTCAYMAYGPTCDPLDCLPNAITGPDDLTEGDYIELGNVGAYGEATVTRFNGYGKLATVTVESVV
ncbi:type III PLP-dependent enzyme [Rhodoligotrophos ferricapiens]|uniref:type III PLP-dependent enzyme n=1 Tax=Rhodoligotrophos ferricapiens TaxID=3069264 RepID=UPI00315CD204